MNKLSFQKVAGAVAVAGLAVLSGCGDKAVQESAVQVDPVLQEQGRQAELAIDRLIYTFRDRADRNCDASGKIDPKTGATLAVGMISEYAGDFDRELDNRFSTVFVLSRHAEGNLNNPYNFKKAIEGLSILRDLDKKGDNLTTVVTERNSGGAILATGSKTDKTTIALYARDVGTETRSYVLMLDREEKQGLVEFFEAVKTLKPGQTAVYYHDSFEEVPDRQNKIVVLQKGERGIDTLPGIRETRLMLSEPVCK